MTKTKPNLIDLEEISANYANGLVDQLRKFGVGYDGFETWVPDANSTKSIVNLVDAVLEAGSLTSLTIKVSNRLAASLSIDDLIARLSGIVEVSVDSLQDGVIVYLNNGGNQRLNLNTPFEAPQFGVRRSSSRRDPADSKTGPKVPNLDDVDTKKTSGANKNRIYDLDLSDPSCYEDAVLEGVNSVIATANQNGRSLSFKVDLQSRIVEDASFSGQWPEDIKGLLDMLCELARNRDLQDVSDHGVGLLELRMRSDQPRPVPGIVLPSVVDDRFETIQSALHSVLEEYRRATGDESIENFFDEGASQQWQNTPKAEKLSMLGRFFEEAVEEVGLKRGTIELVDLEYDVRVLIRFSEEVNSEGVDKPALMMQLEKKLKDTLERRLELFLEPVKDQSTLRRL